jgi:hypothetical protein
LSGFSGREDPDEVSIQSRPLQHRVNQGIAASPSAVDDIDAAAFRIEKDKKFAAYRVKLHNGFVNMHGFWGKTISPLDGCAFFRLRVKIPGKNVNVGPGRFPPVFLDTRNLAFDLGFHLI